MKALTAIVGKLFHTMESSRTINSMINKKYLGPSAQKAYIQGINGCVEHVQVVQEIIQYSKANHKTVHVTWFDLIDAFGSLPHMLILHVLRHYHIREEIISYTKSMYSKLKGRIRTEKWETEIIEFLKGAFAGDPNSGIIFLISFNPLIEYIKKFKETQGYTIGTTNIITTPFADDFNLVSNNKIQHQKLITDIEEKAKTMGFSFKPSKCRSLSILSGTPRDVTFVITDTQDSSLKVHIDSVHSRPHKCLGSVVTYYNTPKNHFEYFHKILKGKLENIEKSKVRGEHKLAVYERYALPSLRFYLSIHDMHDTHLEKMDKLAKKYIKKWLSYPTHGVTDLGIFHPYLLKVKQPSQIYLEGHTGNLALMRLKGDQTVQACINSKLERESNETQKSSTIVKSSQMIAGIVNTNQTSTMSYGTTLRQNITFAKRAVKLSVQEEVKEAWNNKVRKLTMQGEFANLLIEEKESVTWQSVIRKMPRNVMSFASRLSTNSLNSPDNLVRWGKRKWVIVPCAPA
jgi:hypothetical protein